MEIFNLQSLAQRKVASYMDNNIAMLTNFGELRDFTRDVLLEGYLFAVVMNGTADIIVDDKMYELHEGDVFACHPHNILEKSMFSMDLEARSMYVTPEFAEEIANMMNIDWTFRMMVQTHEIVRLDKTSLNNVKAYFDLIQNKLDNDSTPNLHNSIQHLVISMAYALFDKREQTTGEAMPTQRYTSAENIFQHFMKMLNDRKEPFKNVNGYAEALNITPKYFSAICKQVSGKTASEIINGETLRIAQVLLHDNELSIKQVADKLGFANQSHFGSFFRRYLGVSPNQYRSKL